MVLKFKMKRFTLFSPSSHNVKPFTFMYIFMPASSQQPATTTTAIISSRVFSPFISSLSFHFDKFNFFPVVLDFAISVFEFNRKFNIKMKQIHIS